MGNAAAIRRFSSRRQKGDDDEDAACEDVVGNASAPADVGRSQTENGDKCNVRCTHCDTARPVSSGAVAFTCQCGSYVRVPFAAAAKAAKAEAVEVFRKTEAVMQAALKDQAAVCQRKWMELKRRFDEEDMLQGCADLPPEAIRARSISRTAVAARDAEAAADALDQWVALNLPLTPSLRQSLTAIQREEQGESILRNLARVMAVADGDRVRPLCSQAAAQGFGLPVEIGAALRALDAQERAANAEREYQTQLQSRVMEAHARHDMEALTGLAAEARMLGEDASVIEAVLFLSGCRKPRRLGKAPASGRQVGEKQPNLGKVHTPSSRESAEAGVGSEGRSAEDAGSSQPGAKEPPQDCVAPPCRGSSKSSSASAAEAAATEFTAAASRCSVPCRPRAAANSDREPSPARAAGEIFRSAATRSISHDSPRASSEARARPFAAIARSIGRSIARPASAGAERPTSNAERFASGSDSRPSSGWRRHCPSPTAPAPAASSMHSVGSVPEQGPAMRSMSRPATAPSQPASGAAKPPTPRISQAGSSSSSRAPHPPGGCGGVSASRPPRPASAQNVGGQHSRPCAFQPSAPTSAPHQTSSNPHAVGGGGQDRAQAATPQRPSSAQESRRRVSAPSLRRTPTVEAQAPPRSQQHAPQSPSSGSKAAMTRQSALAILGITCMGNPTLEEVRRAYKQAALRWHPDRQANHGCAEEAKQRFQEVRAAFELLQASLKSAAPMGGA